MKVFDIEHALFLLVGQSLLLLLHVLEGLSALPPTSLQELPLLLLLPPPLAYHLVDILLTGLLLVVGQFDLEIFSLVVELSN